MNRIDCYKVSMIAVIRDELLDELSRFEALEGLIAEARYSIDTSKTEERI